MSQSLFSSAHGMLLTRSIWEQKQRLYYQMRHDGLRRIRKPFPSAADLHFPEIDMAIRRLKPYWMGQAQSGERLVDFVSMTDQLETMSDAAADYFHFQITQRTDFLRKLRVAIDTMLLRGVGVIKAWADPFEKYALKFDAIDPLYVILPDCANGFEDADEFVHVRQMTVAQYQRDRLLNQDKDVVSRIRGSERFESFALFVQDKQIREGITYAQNPNRILLWDHYTRRLGGWMVDVYSPQQPDLELRQPFGVPYKIAGKVSIPFFKFVFEVKDEGWFSSRGLGELLAPVEQYLCKLWNEKADAMTYGNRPVFTSEGEIQNTANLRWAPGEFIPRNVKAVQMPPPPFSFDQELGFARAIGEEQSQSPDFGITSPGGPSDTGNKPRTATENQRISALSQAGTNDNASFFREDLAKVYRHVWGLICQFKERDFTYYAAGKIGTLPAEALHDSYLIAPSGSPDAWDRMKRFQKSVARLQMWKGDPNCNQDFLKRSVMAADDAQFAQKAFVPSNLASAGEAEDEAMEIVILCDGFPAAVKPGEDHATRIMVLVGWLVKQQMGGQPVDATAKLRVFQHLQQHWQYLKETQPEAAKALAAKILEAEKAMAQQAHAASNGAPAGTPLVANGGASPPGPPGPLGPPLATSPATTPQGPPPGAATPQGPPPGAVLPPGAGGRGG